MQYTGKASLLEHLKHLPAKQRISFLKSNSGQLITGNYKFTKHGNHDADKCFPQGTVRIGNIYTVFSYNRLLEVIMRIPNSTDIVVSDSVNGSRILSKDSFRKLVLEYEILFSPNSIIALSNIDTDLLAKLACGRFEDFVKPSKDFAEVIDTVIDKLEESLK